jgi:hypothetical protein
LLESIKDGLGVVFGSAAGVVIALCGLAGVVVATLIDPAAAAVASAALLVGIVAILVYALRQRTLFAGPYQVLDETIVWEFTAADGHEAFHSKRQRVRFNYLVVAHIELAHGDGDLFAEFECDYGSFIRRFSRDEEDGVLVQLKPERTRGEEVEINSRRKITDGFIGPEQWVTQLASVPSRRSELIVQFPQGASVSDVRITGPTRHGSRPARSSELRAEGARQVLRLKPRRYRANQRVKVTWRW